MSDVINEVGEQRRYYAKSAEKYDEMHTQDDKGEHYFGLSFLVATIDYLEVKSILDIGSGTGRAIRYIKEHRPDIRVVGVEPVKELREIGYSHGLSQDEIVEGDATSLKFDTSSFDLVCEFGVLHHIQKPERAVSEMLRVADKAIFISDSNNFGQGSLLSRSVKQILNFFGLWKIVDLIKTKGKGYTISEGDGLAYSYSVFNSFRQVKAQCVSTHILNTKNSGVNPYRSASHVVLLGIKR